MFFLVMLAAHASEMNYEYLIFILLLSNSKIFRGKEHSQQAPIFFTQHSFTFKCLNGVKVDKNATYTVCVTI